MGHSERAKLSKTWSVALYRPVLQQLNKSNQCTAVLRWSEWMLMNITIFGCPYIHMVEGKAAQENTGHCPHMPKSKKQVAFYAFHHYERWAYVRLPLHNNIQLCPVCPPIEWMNTEHCQQILKLLWKPHLVSAIKEASHIGFIATPVYDAHSYYALWFFLVI